MKKLLFFLLFCSFVFGWNIKGSEKYVLDKTIKGIKIIYNVNGDIIYLSDVIKDLKKMENIYKNTKGVDFGYPIDIDYLKHYLLHNDIPKINAYNHSLRLLEYAIFITAYNYGKADKKLRPILKKQYEKLLVDFRTLLKMSRMVAGNKNNLYHPTFFNFGQYKSYIVGDELYNFIYNYK